MAEPVTTLATAGTIGYIGKDLALKVLGPSCEYLGDQLKLFTEKNIQNLKSICRKAEKKQEPEMATQGEVSPRVIKELILEGAFCEDAISQEYYAGVIASSKTTNNRDDRGAIFSKRVSSLSSYQLRAHYIFYTIFYNSNKDTNIDPNQSLSEQLDKLKTSLNPGSFLIALDLNEDEKANFPALVTHILHGLKREDLVQNWQTGKSGISFTPSSLGIELYLWSQGRGKKHVLHFFEQDFIPIEIENVIITNYHEKKD